MAFANSGSDQRSGSIFMSDGGTRRCRLSVFTMNVMSRKVGLDSPISACRWVADVRPLATSIERDVSRYARHVHQLPDERVHHVRMAIPPGDLRVIHPSPGAGPGCSSSLS